MLHNFFVAESNKVFQQYFCSEHVYVNGQFCDEKDGLIAKSTMENRGYRQTMLLATPPLKTIVC